MLSPTPPSALTARQAVKGILAENPALEKLLPLVFGNIGFVFTKDDLALTRDVCVANKARLLRARCTPDISGR